MPLESPTPGVALALSGGAARGLAHIGVLDVLEREGLWPRRIAGTSMGGLIGALAACGVSGREMAEIARGFAFPRWFVPGAVVAWDRIFPSAVRVLAGRSFEHLAIPLAVTATDLESGRAVLIADGSLLPAVRATCAIPGVMPPVRLGDRWLVDGGLVNVLPVDAAQSGAENVVVAVRVHASRWRHKARLDRRLTAALLRLGSVLPNPATAKLSFEILLRAAEIALERQLQLGAAMIGPEILIEVDVGDVGLRDFHRLGDLVAAGHRAAEAALPEIQRLLVDRPERHARSGTAPSLVIDPVCDMAVNPARARASAEHEGRVYYFCSQNCREAFDTAPARYAGGGRLGAPPVTP